jgi:hypothetical protein
MLSFVVVSIIIVVNKWVMRLEFYVVETEFRLVSIITLLRYESATANK